jgi:hypothetical protein
MIGWRPTLPRPPPEINTHLGHYPTVGRFAVAALSERRSSLRIQGRRSETAATRIKLTHYPNVSRVSAQGAPRVTEKPFLPFARTPKVCAKTPLSSRTPKVTFEWSAGRILVPERGSGKSAGRRTRTTRTRKGFTEGGRPGLEVMLQKAVELGTMD